MIAIIIVQYVRHRRAVKLDIGEAENRDKERLLKTTQQERSLLFEMVEATHKRMGELEQKAQENQQVWAEQTKRAEDEVTRLTGELGVANRKIEALLQRVKELEVLNSSLAAMLIENGQVLTRQAGKKVQVTQVAEKGELLSLILDRVGESELQTAVFHLELEGVEWEKLTGNNYPEKAMSLLTALDNRQAVSLLVDVLRESRPDVPWGNSLGARKRRM